MNKLISFVLVAMLFLTGCAPVFMALSPEQKLDFYERVIEQAQDHRERALFLEQKGFLAKAQEEYEKGLFFGDISGIDPAQVENLKNRIKNERQTAYVRAQRAFTQDNEQVALKAFNQVLKLDPHYEDAQQHYDVLLKDPKNTALLKEKTAQLNQFLSQKHLSNTQRHQRDQAVNEVLNLRHDHRQAFKYLLQQYELESQEKNIGMVHLRQAREAFARNDLKAAETEFKKAQTFSVTQQKATRGLVQLQKRKDAIYLTALAKNALAANQTQKAEGYLKRALAAERNYQPAQNLLADLRQQHREANAQVKLTQGRQLLKQGHYIQALNQAGAVLIDDPKHPDALALKADVNKTIKHNSARLLKEGELYFNQNRFDEALARFEMVLIVEPDNQICKTYVVRINKRRETIEMLSR
ncbi:MAG: tetratricopeptide repeat protein [Thiomicrospira sp.]|uniref:tetratricopeptide repeat protein n=1 Tax=Thiomicrospira sp. TaxID=935 RepID=UPI0019E77609|nr:tetratricopeptide repeat protein [Thiomicrospira sp.]MBE0494460.1 tetratricopeptide repeat protein [Thiomicrospira sp.]